MPYTKTFADGAGAELAPVSLAQRALGWICGQLDIGQLNQITKELHEDLKDVNDRVDTLSGSLGVIDFKDDFITGIAFNPVTNEPDARSMTISYAPTGDEQVTDITVLVRGFTFTGMIVPYHGPASGIPQGWQICDGSNGTPNLRDRFIRGADSVTDTAVTGGAATATTAGSGRHSHNTSGRTGGTALTVDQLPPHNHDVNDPGHTHNHQDEGSSGSFELDDGNDLFVPTSRPDTTRTTAPAQTGISIRDTGGGQPHDHSVNIATAEAPDHTHIVNTLPPFYELAYIKKL